MAEHALSARPLRQERRIKTFFRANSRWPRRPEPFQKYQTPHLTEQTFLPPLLSLPITHTAHTMVEPQPSNYHFSNLALWAADTKRRVGWEGKGFVDLDLSGITGDARRELKTIGEIENGVVGMHNVCNRNNVLTSFAARTNSSHSGISIQDS